MRKGSKTYFLWSANRSGTFEKHPLFSVIVSISFLFIYCTNIQAQVRSEGEKSNLSDTSVILNLINKGKELTRTEPDKALPYLTEALNKSYEIKYAKGIVLATTKISLWHYGNDINATIDEAYRGLQVYEKESMNNLEMKAELHLILAEAYDEKGKKDSSAFYYYLLGREIENNNITDPELTINVFTKLTIFWINFNYDINTNSDYIQMLSRYVEKAKSAASLIKDTADSKSSVLFLQGAFYHGIKQFDSARYYYLSYLDKRDKLNKLSLPRRISTLTNITDTYLQENKPDQALVYIDKVAQIGTIPEQNKFLVFYIAFNELQRGKALYQQKKYAASIDLIDKTIMKLKTTGEHLRDEVVEAYKITADSYEALGDFKNALRFKNQYLALHDSLNKKEKIDIVHGLEIRYRLSEKDKELAQQQLTIAEVNNKVKSRNAWIVVISLLIFFTATIFGLWRRKNIHKQKLQQEQINNFQQEMEIARLNATITGEERERTRIATELHDGIGGLLAAAKMNFELIRKQNPRYNTTDFNDGVKLLEDASSELRKTAHNMMPEMLLQNGLSEAVEYFCNTIGKNSETNIMFQSTGQSKRYGNAFELSVYRIVQELIHNIVKHANATEALVQISFYESGIDITIEDNGIGMTEDIVVTAAGMGLKSIAGRANAMNGKLDIQSKPGLGTSAHLEFLSPPSNHNDL